MKRILTTVIFSLATFLLFSQSISVQSFKRISNDMDARVNHPIIDQNGEKCAIIKIVTSENDFSWEGDGLGIQKSEKKTGEFWVYVPRGAKRITIKHNILGVLRDYVYSESIESATCYELILTTARVRTIIESTILSQWLVINPHPADALIYINDIFESTGILQKKFPVGKYTYRIESPMYHSEAGIIELLPNSSKKITLNPKLKPNFGYLKLTTKPEENAFVKVDGIDVSGTTPIFCDKLKSGEHSLAVTKPMFKPKYQTISIYDDDTLTLSVDLEPNFATLNLNSLGCDLFINGENKGKDSWTGPLGAGVYTLEAKKDKYKPGTEDIILNIGENRKIDLNPSPITGKLDVITSPSDAQISINDISYGSTPTTIPDLIIGDYKVKISKQGHGSVEKNVTILENKTSSLDVTIPKGKDILFNSVPTDAFLYIDNNYVGLTPTNATLSFGNHAILLKKSGIQFEKDITVDENTENTLTYPVKVLKTIKFETDQEGDRLYIDDKYIGGTPQTLKLTADRHTVKVVRNDNVKWDFINLEESNRSLFYYSLNTPSSSNVSSPPNNNKSGSRNFALSFGYTYNNSGLSSAYVPSDYMGADIKVEYSYLYLNPSYSQLKAFGNSFNYYRMSGGLTSMRFDLFTPFSLDVFGGAGYEISVYKSQTYFSVNNDLREGDLHIGVGIWQVGSLLTLNLFRQVQLYGTLEYIAPLSSTSDIDKKINGDFVNIYQSNKGFISTVGIRFELGSN